MGSPKNKSVNQQLAIMQSLPKISKTLRRCPSIMEIITPPIALPPKIIKNPVVPSECKPSFCRYVRCKNPVDCKLIGACYVDWEPELIKE